MVVVLGLLLSLIQCLLFCSGFCQGAEQAAARAIHRGPVRDQTAARQKGTPGQRRRAAAGHCIVIIAIVGCAQKVTRRQEHMKKVAGRPGFIAMGTTPTSVTRSIFKMNIRV